MTETKLRGKIRYVYVIEDSKGRLETIFSSLGKAWDYCKEEKQQTERRSKIRSLFKNDESCFLYLDDMYGFRLGILRKYKVNST